MKRYFQICAGVTLAVVLSGAVLHPVDAANPFGSPKDKTASSWAENPYAKARLISAETALAPDRPSLLGVQIAVKPGWKTYWRSPGASGVPPQFSWKKSTNLASAQIRWPAPKWLRDEFGVSAGYEGGVVFPVEIIPRDATRPVSLDLVLYYAACKDICVPVQASLTFTLRPGGTPATSRHAGLIRRYNATVPNVTTAAKPRVLAANIVSVKTPAARAVMVEVDPGKSATPPELFVEGPKQYFFGKPELVQRGKGVKPHRYRVKITNVPAEAKLKGVQITATVVGAASASEQTVTLR